MKLQHINIFEAVVLTLFFANNRFLFLLFPGSCSKHGRIV